MRQAESVQERRRRWEYFSRNVPNFDAASVGLFRALLRTSITFKGALERRMRSYGLSGPAFGVLALLETLPERRLPMHDLSRRLWVTPANVTGLVDNLERKRLVQRRPLEKDRRVITVGLTREGRQKVRALLPKHFLFVRQLFGRLRGREKADLARLLDKMRMGSG